MSYSTKGSVRGACGHRHRTLGGAIACLRRDRAGCKRQGGYSDRIVYEDGEPMVEGCEGGWLTSAEWVRQTK